MAAAADICSADEANGDADICTLFSGGFTLGPKSWLAPSKFSRTAVLLTHCGQLILINISELDATRWQILRLECTKFDFSWGWGPAPDPAWGAYSAPQTS